MSINHVVFNIWKTTNIVKYKSLRTLEEIAVQWTGKGVEMNLHLKMFELSTTFLSTRTCNMTLVDVNQVVEQENKNMLPETVAQKLRVDAS